MQARSDRNSVAGNRVRLFLGRCPSVRFDPEIPILMWSRTRLGNMRLGCGVAGCVVPSRNQRVFFVAFLTLCNFLLCRVMNGELHVVLEHAFLNNEESAVILCFSSSELVSE